MGSLAPYLVAGVVTGSILVLPAIAFSTLYSILRFPNFAVGAYMTAGAYMAFAVNRGLGWSIAASFAVAVVSTAGLAVVVDRLTFRQMRHGRPLALLVTSIGVAFVLENLARFFWGNDLQSYDIAVHRPWVVGPFRINGDQVWIMGVAAAFLVAVHLLLASTRIGKAMRATADNVDLASVRGIEPEQIIVITSALGGGLSGAAGVLLGIDSIVSPTMGWNVLILVFAAAILGGIGSAYGAMLGAISIALVAEASTAVFPPTYKTAFGFAIKALLLLFRPRGLLGVRP
jgi:branched-chain amino acid transport system permease protein/neutral amino acid transport system permease protein